MVGSDAPEVVRRDRRVQSWGLLAILVGYLALGLMITVGTPPWEANDEPDHLRNVESLVDGHMYQIFENGGLESHQPPLYYLGLAAWQEMLGISVHGTRPAFNPSGAPQTGQWDHSTPAEGGDQRFVVLMRLTSLLAGVGVIVLTFLTARLVATSRYTPLVAGAFVAFLPKFVFLSAVVNNDNLADLLASAVVFVSARAVVRRDDDSVRRTYSLALTLGTLVGLSLATKLTAVAIILPAALALSVVARRSQSFIRPATIFGAAVVIPSAPWIWFTKHQYNDVFAADASGRFFDVVLPGLMRKHVDAHVYLVELPGGFFKSFWYSSGWNQYVWGWTTYIPFWAIFLPACAVGVRRLSVRSANGRGIGGMLGLTVIASVLVFVYIGTITTGSQARVSFVGLTAFAVIYALGVERLHVAARFVLPLLGAVGTFVAFRNDVVDVFVNR